MNSKNKKQKLEIETLEDKAERIKAEMAYEEEIMDNKREK